MSPVDQIDKALALLLTHPNELLGREIDRIFGVFRPQSPGPEEATSSEAALGARLMAALHHPALAWAQPRRIGPQIRPEGAGAARNGKSPTLSIPLAGEPARLRPRVVGGGWRTARQLRGVMWGGHGPRPMGTIVELDHDDLGWA